MPLFDQWLVEILLFYVFEMFARDPTDSTRLDSTDYSLSSTSLYGCIYTHFSFSFQCEVPVFTRQIQHDFNVNLHNFPRQTVQENIELPKYFDTEFRVDASKNPSKIIR